MKITPLHVAFVWVLKPNFKKMNFAALTVGAVIPDIEPLIAWILAGRYFAVWIFHALVPRQVGIALYYWSHNHRGCVLTMIFVKIIGKLGLER